MLIGGMPQAVETYVVHTKDYKWENGIHYLPV